MEYFCNIINAFTVTFDQFNASWLIKVIIALQKTHKKTKLTPKLYT